MIKITSENKKYNITVHTLRYVVLNNNYNIAVTTLCPLHAVRFIIMGNIFSDLETDNFT